MPEFDATDGTILAERTLKRSARSGARVGDFIHMLDGTLRRFTHHWGDSIQVSSFYDGRVQSGSFYLDRSGAVSYSGGLDPAIPLEKIADTGEHLAGSFWIFHHDHHRAHNGVHVEAPCRVFKQVA